MTAAQRFWVFALAAGWAGLWCLTLVAMFGWFVGLETVLPFL